MSEDFDMCLFLELLHDQQDVLVAQLQCIWLCDALDDDTFARRVIALHFLKQAMTSPVREIGHKQAGLRPRVG